MSAGKCPMGQSLGVSHGTAPPKGRLGQMGHAGQSRELGLPNTPARPWGLELGGL
jgi:hypothetical protein